MLQQAVGSIDCDGEALDVFDAPSDLPSDIFVNPFACSINPLDWRKLQVRLTPAYLKRYYSFSISRFDHGTENHVSVSAARGCLLL